eukprot:gene229-432_t
MLPAAAAVEAHSSKGALSTVLSQYKEAQAAWAQEKAKLRRDAVVARKQASKLELELARATRLQQHAALDVASLKAALKGRDVVLEEAMAKVKHLEEVLARSQEAAAQRLVSMQQERDDMQALLLATLAKLEGVEAVVAAADSTSAAMEEKGQPTPFNANIAQLVALSSNSCNPAGHQHVAAATTTRRQAADKQLEQDAVYKAEGAAGCGCALRALPAVP